MRCSGTPTVVYCYDQASTWTHRSLDQTPYTCHAVCNRLIPRSMVRWIVILVAIVIQQTIIHCSPATITSASCVDGNVRCVAAVSVSAHYCVWEMQDVTCTTWCMVIDYRHDGGTVLTRAADPVQFMYTCLGLMYPPKTGESGASFRLLYTVWRSLAIMHVSLSRRRRFIVRTIPFRGEIAHEKSISRENSMITSWLRRWDCHEEYNVSVACLFLRRFSQLFF